MVRRGGVRMEPRMFGSSLRNVLRGVVFIPRNGNSEVFLSGYAVLVSVQLLPALPVEAERI